MHAIADALVPASSYKKDEWVDSYANMNLGYKSGLLIYHLCAGPIYHAVSKKWQVLFVGVKITSDCPKRLWSSALRKLSVS